MTSTSRCAASVAALSVLFLLAAPAQAHRSGCHRWHSCPSDTGSYVCGDLGYTTYCGTTAVPATPARVSAAPPVSGSNVRYTTTGVNLRAGPSAQSQKLATLTKGLKVNLISCAASWCRVSWQGKSGYVAQTYLRR